MTAPLPSQSPLRQLRDENDRLKRDLDQLRQQNDVYRAFVRGLHELQQARSAVATESDLVAFLDSALASAIAGSQANDGSLLMVDSDSGELVFMQVRGSISATLPGYHSPKGEGIAGWVAEHGLPQLVNEPYADSRFSRRVDTHFQFSTRNLLAVPITGQAGVLGVLEVLNKQDGQLFTTHDLDLLGVVADLLTGAITRVDIATRGKP